MLRIVLLVCLAGIRFGNTLTSECNITGTTANCSNRHLTYIPSLHNSIRILIFKNNSLGKITNATFVNATFLESIDVTNNGIKNISDDAFTCLTRLNTLILDTNHMPVENLKAGFRSLNKPHLKMLGLNDMFSGDIDKDLFGNLNESGISKIQLRMNNIQNVNISVFNSLRNLSNLDISKNFIFYLCPDSHVLIKQLNIDNNKLSMFDKQCGKMPSLQRLYMTHNDILYLSADVFQCFPNLEIIDISKNPVTEIYNNSFAYLHKLKNVTLDKMCGLTTIEHQAFKNSNVKTISLRHNNLYFLMPKLSSGMFNDCVNLTNLYLSGNNMMKTNPEYLNALFRPINHTLIYLKLDNCILRTFPPNLSSFPNLMFLDLTGNELRVVHRHNFPHKLRWISLKDNDITSVNKYSLPANLTKLQIDLSQNEFDCTCELLWFLNKFEATKPDHTFFQTRGNYNCSSPLQTSGISLDVFAGTIGVQACLLASNTYLIILSSLSFFVIFIIVGTFLYYYRWHFRYFLYMLRSSRLHRIPEDNEFIFDAFVAYSDKDLSWILQEAIPRLEKTEGIQLCFHQRNFQLGALVVDNIVHCVNSSRKFIILLSNNFARSQWCQFELAIIQRQIRSQCHDILMVVKLDTIDQRHISPSIFDLIISAKFIEWPDTSRARDTFWTHLIHCIRQTPSSLRPLTSSYKRLCSEDPEALNSIVRHNVCNRSISENAWESTHNSLEESDRCRSTI